MFRVCSVRHHLCLNLRSSTCQRHVLRQEVSLVPTLVHDNSDCYNAQVVDHYDNPRNVGSFNKNDEDVGTGLVGAPACGDVMKLQLRVRAVLVGYKQ